MFSVFTILGGIAAAVLIFLVYFVFKMDLTTDKDDRILLTALFVGGVGCAAIGAFTVELHIGTASACM